MSLQKRAERPRKTFGYHFAEGRSWGPPGGYVVRVRDRRLRAGYPGAAFFSESHGTPTAGWVQTPRPVPSPEAV